MSRVQVFIGTKAQYVKTAPLLRLMDDRGVPYRLIDSGQHAELSRELREELRVREPDHLLGGSRDITSIPQAIAWSARLAMELPRGARLRREVFGGEGGICVVHGDTPSTLLSTLMARRAGLQVAHLEAGLRSHRLLHPFPEELIRIVVMRLAQVLFAPDAEAERNLRLMRLGTRTVRTSGNTVLDALRYSLRDTEVAPTGPVIATMHRVENLHRAARVEAYVSLLERLAQRRPVRFVLHGPTTATLEGRGDLRRLERAGVELAPLAPHAAFTRMLAAAPLVMTDGGSIQEECALLGVPTLLWRGHTERPDGIGRNVVLADYDPSAADRLLDEPERFRVPPVFEDVSPTEEILEILLARLDAAGRTGR
jgi:UDP-N-acetylglucosamine 2-epimerase (non-hydrolysing)